MRASTCRDVCALARRRQVCDRLGMTSQRRNAPQTRLRYIAPVGVVVIAVVIAVALATVVIGSGRSLIPGPSSVQATAAPGAPTHLIRLDTGNDERGVGRHVADYLSDGTVIRLNGKTLERNTLTATGLTALRALLAQDSDLLAFNPQILPSEPSNPNTTNTFVLAQPNGSRYTVNAPSLTAPDGSVWATNPAFARLGTLAAALLDPATLVGVAGLAQPIWAAYQPTQMAVFIRFANVDPQFAAEGLAPDISSTGWPFAGAPDALGTTFTDPSGIDRRCAFLPRADVEKALISLPNSVGGSLAAGQLASGVTWHSGTLLWGAKSPTTSLSLIVVPLLPEDVAASCADALAY